MTSLRAARTMRINVWTSTGAIRKGDIQKKRKGDIHFHELGPDVMYPGSYLEATKAKYDKKAAVHEEVFLRDGREKLCEPQSSCI